MTTPERLQAAEVIERSVEGSDSGKYDVAESLGMEADDVDRVLSAYAAWLRGDDEEESA
jgi:hypothetical protein